MSSCSRISCAMRWPVAPVPRTSIESRSGSQAATLVRPARRSSSTSRPGISRTRSRVSGQRREGLVEQLLALGHGVAPRRVQRGGQQRVGAGRLDQGHRAVDHVLVDELPVAEVQDRRLGQAADDLVGAGEDEVGAAAKRPGRQVLVEVEVGAPGLVDDQRDVAGVGDLGELLDPRDRPEVGGRDEHHRLRVRLRVERGTQGLGRDAVGDAELRIDLGRDEGRAQPGEHQPVDDRGVDVALDDHRPAVGRSGSQLPARVGEGHADRVVSAGGAVDQEPAALGAPGLGREALRALEWGRLGPDVDPLDAGRDVMEDGGLAEGVGQPGVGAGALVPGDVEPPRVRERRRRRVRRGRGLRFGRPSGPTESI